VVLLLAGHSMHARASDRHTNVPAGASACPRKTTRIWSAGLVRIANQASGRATANLHSAVSSPAQQRLRAACNMLHTHQRLKSRSVLRGEVLRVIKSLAQHDARRRLRALTEPNVPDSSGKRSLSSIRGRARAIAEQAGASACSQGKHSDTRLDPMVRATAFAHDRSLL
jgi:hypothetical protein